MLGLVLDSTLTAEQREYLLMAMGSGETLLRVINDILDFSKIEAGRLELDPIPFNIRDHVEETTKALALKAHEKGLELIYNVGPAVPEYVVGDVTRLRQIMVNLLGNAIKFTERGEVELEVAVQSRSGSQLGLHFMVRDTGIGIPVEKQQMIFEAFSQVDGSTTRKYGGTGLGLTISSRLVEAMAGKIWVENRAEGGTCFHFTAGLALAEIPFATTRTYGEQARVLGAPRAARAVGAANGRNPLPIVLPCHRLVGADGSLTGFGGGLDVKRALLDHEAGTAARAAAAGSARTRTSRAPRRRT